MLKEIVWRIPLHESLTVLTTEAATGEPTTLYETI